MRDNLEALLFTPPEGRAGLSEADARRLVVYEDLFHHWMQQEYLSDAQMVSYAEQEHGVSRRTAYRYVGEVKELLGRVRTPTRAWYRYQVTQMLLRAYTLSLAAEDSRGMIAAADALGKYTNLDKPEVESPDWSSIAPPSFEPSGDATLVGVEAGDPSQYSDLRRRLGRKYNIPQDVVARGSVVCVDSVESVESIESVECVKEDGVKDE